MQKLKTILTLAGSDSSGGAGVQADIKTISAHDMFGTSVVAAITAQNSSGVQGTFDLEVDVVEAQLRAVLEDEKPAAVKTGMLGNDEIVLAVAKILKRSRIKNLVVDPIIRSSNGKTLLSKKGVDAVQSKLLPLALIVTPNLPEAQVLSGIPIRSDKDRKKAAKVILKTGVKWVLIKGGHGKKHADDYLTDGKKEYIFQARRLEQEGLHGTGCALSAALACGLARGLKVPEAVEHAKGFVSMGIAQGVRAGNGVGHVNPMALMNQSRQRFEILQGISAAVDILKANQVGALIPEVQSNIGVGLPGAQGMNDVAAIPGRIVRLEEGVVTVAAPQFGASQHVAKIVLTAMSFDPQVRAVMNIKFTDTILKACRNLKFKVGSFDRGKEPKNVKEHEGSSLEWGTHDAIRRLGYVPDIIFDLGGQGKEEMIRVLAPDIGSLLGKVLSIHKEATRIRPAKERDRWRKR